VEGVPSLPELSSGTSKGALPCTASGADWPYRLDIYRTVLDTIKESILTCLSEEVSHREAARHQRGSSRQEDVMT
jgi:hypothetical protein